MAASRGEPHVSGTLVLEQRAALEHVVGAEVAVASLAALPSSMKDEIIEATALSWVRIASLEALFAAAAERVGRDLGALHHEVARRAIERTMKTVFRLLMRVTTDEALISRAPVMYAKTYDRGHMLARIVAPGSAQVEISDWPEMPDWPLRGVAIGIRTALEIARRLDVRVRAERRADGAVFFATWKG